MASSSSLVVGCLAAVLLSACTSSSPPGTTQPTPSATSPIPTAASPTPSPSVTSTWSPEQLDALQSVEDYRAAIRPIAEDPAGFTEAKMRAILGKVAAREIVDANVSSYLSLKKRGFRYDGDAEAISTKVTDVSKREYGFEAFVTKCLDQRAIRVVDEAGREVSESELGYAVPDFNLRQYTVIKRTGTQSFLVYGLAPAKGECGS